MNFKMKVKRICKNCNKIFEAWPSTVKYNSSKYCCFKCYNKFRRKENNPNWQQIKAICQNCGKPYYKRRYLKDISKYCCFNCLNEGNGKNRTGKPLTIKTKRKISEYRKNWHKNNPEFRKKLAKIRMMITKKCPIQPEKIFDEMTPDIVRFIGNKAWWRKLDDGQNHNPDFKVTGQDKVIEVFGDYWHRNDNPQELIDLYNQAGIKCLIFWEKEIYNNPEMVIKEVNNFIGGKNESI